MIDRRTFMRIMAGAVAGPVIGLPTPTEAAPAPIDLGEVWGIDWGTGCSRYIIYLDRVVIFDSEWPAPRAKWSHVHNPEEWEDWSDFPRMPLDGEYRIPHKAPHVPQNPRTESEG